MAHTVAIGEKMVAAAHHSGRTLGVNYNYRSVPSHRLIKQELERGGLGAPSLFSAHAHAYLFPHLLDLLRFFFGDPVEVTAALVDDQALRPPVSAGPSGGPWVFPADDAAPMLYHPSIAASASLRFRSSQAGAPDFLATLSGSALLPLEANFWSFALYGTGGTLLIDRATRANLNGTPSLGHLAEQIAALPPYSYPQSFEDSVGAFVESVRAGKPVPVTGEDGLAVLRLDAAIVQAAQTGGTVPFKASI
jgi:predicted dehydrogenase